MPRKKTIRKRGNGDGSIFELGDGRWRAVVSCGQIGGRRIRRSKIARSRDEAKDKLRELLEETYGKVAPAPDKTLAEWLNEWLQSKRAASLAENTIDSYRMSIENHLVPKMGPAKLRDITPAQIDIVVGKIKGDRTRQLAFAVLRMALKRAARKGLISHNPAEVADRPGHKRETIDPFDADQVKRILEASEGDRLRAVYVLAFSLGLRQGELFGLRWRDVDLKAGTISIRQQAAEVRGNIIFREPKSTAGIRTVKVPAVAVTALRERKAIAMKEGHAAAELVFLNQDGKVIRRSNFGKWCWRPLLKRLKIKHRGFHHARHTAASLMLGDGYPVHVVCHTLGHSKPSVTLDLYAHLIAGQDVTPRGQTAALFG
jgi:integrase